MNRNAALHLMTKMVETGYQKRDMFVDIIVAQNDWVGAMFKPEAVWDAMRLDVAQNAVMLMTSDPAMTTEQLVATLQQQAAKERSKTRHDTMQELISALRT
jgi:hypothetical protein